ncbi:MAG: iron ABC transporter permease [Rhodospirillaceae bacterium]|jgi:iron(III) transport system permease protein|nr:iron ABC transporter permease [Rhodospirillaceae bacterium]MBT6403595.1 iron ABC transporter permease [Rhodospirillaceae bacterium]MBT6535449.1 iron ABC transporter permease [Rhodospirillaceae bacterium]MBT7361803.1 iron ABC transporter permease [Rhodospirillaceae bacterium]MBT7613457.1 iron ABC transporter permease [Rhodospirillaceae bacterium]
MTTEALSPTRERSPLNNRLRAMLTQENIITLVVAIIVAGAVVVPLAVLFVSSFKVLDPLGWDTTWGFGNYVEMFTDRIIPKAFLNTLIISSGSTILATFLGVSLAWINARTNCPGRDYLEPYNLIPFFLSPFIGAIAWHNLGEPQTGLLNNWVRDIFGVDWALINIDNIYGVIWVTGIFFAPLVYLFVVGSLRRMDPSLEDSARTTGAGLIRTTMTITLPLVMPGILSGAIIVFVTSAGEFGVPFKLSAPYGWETLTTQIFSKAVGDDANHFLGAAMSMALGIITVLLIWIQQRYIAPRSFTTVTGKGFRPNVLDLGPWRWVAFGYNLMFIAVAVVLPIVCLIIVSLHPVWTGKIVWADITTINYVKTLFWWRPDAIAAATNGIVNSLILAFGGASIAMVMALVISYMIHRTKGFGVRMLDFLSVVPIGFPGIVLAMGVLVTYIQTPIYATLWILMLAYITRFFPYGQRNISSIMLAISEELDQSSRMAGASWFTTLWRITIPLLKPGLFAGWILLFIIFLRELSISIILFTTGTETLSVGVYYLTNFENEPLTAALSMAQTVLLLIAIYAFRRFAGREALTA